MKTGDLPQLPSGLRSLTPAWPPETVKRLKEVESGRVNSGHYLSLAIGRLRNSLSLPSCSLDGYARFFDTAMPKNKSTKWLLEVLPTLGNLLLRLPSLLETHFQNPNLDIHADGTTVNTALRLLQPQNPGIVFLSQELIAALLACSFFCLFPPSGKRLQKMNFDKLFAKTRSGYSQKQDNKICCILHYFRRIASDMPEGIVSFERKVLPLNSNSYPCATFWTNSDTPLCKFKVYHSGGIEDQPNEALEVDFADPYFGGLVLGTGTLQEEIRFMINPELIAGMLFLPAMAENEAIEIVGVERFSTYTGYSSFKFSGDYVDLRDVDALGRRKTRIVAIDALNRPGMSQYTSKSVLREVNKAFCGFGFQCKSQPNQKRLKKKRRSSGLDQGYNIGVATGNWGCGVFGGDLEIKIIIQWLAASQARRPFLAYYTFGLGALKKLDKVVHSISSQGWTVGAVWTMLINYSAIKSSKRGTNVGFFQWLGQQ